LAENVGNKVKMGVDVGLLGIIGYYMALETSNKRRLVCYHCNKTIHGSINSVHDNTY